MKYKVDLYEVYNHGKTYQILKFPRIENAWAFDDAPEEDRLMLEAAQNFSSWSITHWQP